MTATAQIQLTTSVRLALSDILTLSSVPVVVVPLSSGFINIFEKATVTYNYKNTPLTNLDSELGFYLVPTLADGGTVPARYLLSNAQSAQSVLGLNQITSSSFVAQNPYPSRMLLNSSSAANIVLALGDGTTDFDPLGGDPSTTVTVNVMYSILQQ